MSHAPLKPNTRVAVLIEFGDNNGNTEPDAEVSVLSAVADKDGKSQPAEKKFDVGPIDAPTKLAEGAALLAADAAPNPLVKLGARVAVKTFFFALRGLLGAR